ncbi:dipeptidase [Planctomicrobium sp. SH527]|uniref:dipeptidase n=1 Tax=Planctomicrobium sp. SH527 TaxID=3448123 RepID=UPI003F5CAE11
MKPIIDVHLDLAWSSLFWNRDLTLTLEQCRESERGMTDHRARGRCTVTLPEMRNGNIRLCLGTVLVRSKPEVNPPEGATRRDLDFRNQTIASAVGHAHVQYYRELEQLGEIRMIRSQADLESHWNSPDDRRIGLILAMEGADPITSPDQAQHWWDMGLRSVGLTHYGQGPYGMGTGFEGPLTAKGFELLKEFERLGMIIDLTHCAEPGFFQILDAFNGRVFASHNMVRALTPGDRQFSEEQVKRLIERDAVIGMALDAWMLYPGWKIHETDPSVVGLDAVANHIDYICQLAGNVRNVGIGSDLDGGFGTEQTPRDLDSIADLQKLDEILSGRGYSQADIEAIFYGNYLQFFSQALPRN